MRHHEMRQAPRAALRWIRLDAAQTDLAAPVHVVIGNRIKGKLLVALRLNPLPVLACWRPAVAMLGSRRLLRHLLVLVQPGAQERDQVIHGSAPRRPRAAAARPPRSCRMTGLAAARRRSRTTSRPR